MTLVVQDGPRSSLWAARFGQTCTKLPRVPRASSPRPGWIWMWPWNDMKPLDLFFLCVPIRTLVISCHTVSGEVYGFMGSHGWNMYESYKLSWQRWACWSCSTRTCMVDVSNPDCPFKPEASAKSNSRGFHHGFHVFDRMDVHGFPRISTDFHVFSKSYGWSQGLSPRWPWGLVPWPWVAAAASGRRPPGSPKRCAVMRCGKISWQWMRSYPLSYPLS